MASTGPKGISDAKVIAALRRHAGVYALAAQELGCDRTNVSRRVERSPKLQAVVQDIEDTIGDVAEGVIFEALRQKDRATARWYARYKLGGRGYGARLTLTDPDGQALGLGGPAQPVEINVTFVHAPPVVDIGHATMLEDHYTPSPGAIEEEIVV